MIGTAGIDLINNRYLLHEPLGAGGMGVVYRATDRLNGRLVALKQVVVPPYQLFFNSRSAGSSLNLALAREFKTLASLRHPNIISVLDYGFDDRRQPFFTMDFLAGSHNILVAGRNRPEAEKIELLLQVLQALVYLHRQGILHRDLKPDNILVTGSQVKLLDFGLSTPLVQEQDTWAIKGTLAYMAPELFNEASALTRQSDLYAAGMIAYEMLIGHHPFYHSEFTRLIHRILHETPDLGERNLNPNLGAVLLRLLAKQPAERYETAGEVIAALCLATGRPMPPETIEIRQSFLEAAQFVGRNEELAHLSAALTQLAGGKGGAWLIGGESGVGKSRLLEELRTLALVKAVTVFQGQAVEGGGRPYEMWQESFRRLALLPDLTLEEAAVLKTFVPDIETLVNRPVPDPSRLEPQLSQSRLFQVVNDLFRRQGRPVLLLLEDLQWAGGVSLDLLARLQQLATNSPLLIIGDFRDDERPDLPALLPEMTHLKLARLDKASISALSASMLGEAGQDEKLVERLQRETEGNPFFLVEVVQALAEESGHLEGIRPEQVPQQLWPGHIQAIIQRRLEQLPDAARPFLILAAVAGRELDLPLLRLLVPEVQLDGWLSLCTRAAVLAVYEDRWRFSHDKLREGILLTLSDEEGQNAHREVAGAIEAIYPNAPERAGVLADHWGQAGEPERERRYATRAGNYAAAQFANATAVRYLSRALALAPISEEAERYELLLAREAVYHLQGNREAQAGDLALLRALAESGRGPERLAEVATRQAGYFWAIGDYAAVIETTQEIINLGQKVKDGAMESRGHWEWGWAAARQGDYDSAQERFGRALELARKSRSSRLEGDSLNGLGTIAWYKRELVEANAFYEAALTIRREIGHQQGEGNTLTNLGNLAWYLGDLQPARIYYEQALAISRKLGHRRGEGVALNNLGAIHREEGKLAGAQASYEKAARLCHEIGDRGVEGAALTGLGGVLQQLGDGRNAVRVMEEAAALRRELGNPALLVECLAAMAVIYQAAGSIDRSLVAVEEALRLLAAGHSLDGAEEPLRVYLNCYRVLQAQEDERAAAVLKTAVQRLQAQAAKIPDPAARAAFLKNVSWNREIMAESATVVRLSSPTSIDQEP
jgi:tetratricopeptide (TPR) repeat protein